MVSVLHTASFLFLSYSTFRREKQPKVINQRMLKRYLFKFSNLQKSKNRKENMCRDYGMHRK